MIIVGHKWIKSSRFFKVFSLEDIKRSQAGDVLLFEPLVDSHLFAAHCQEHDIPYAVAVSSLNDALFANALEAKYIICEEEDALMIQPIGQEYLFDTRVLVLIHTEKEIAKIARAGIDGVIVASAIVNS